MYTTQGIILKKMDVGEADALYTIYTKDFGKIQALARGIRKEGAKLRGHLESLSLSAIRFVAGRGRERLIAASLICFGEGMRSRETTLGLAFQIAERIDTHCFPGERDAALWELLSGSLSMLDGSTFDDGAAPRFLQEFDARLQMCLGYGSGDRGGEDTVVAGDPSMAYN